MLRVHVHTAGSVLTAQQPLNNVARITWQALSAVLGGIQSMACCAYDEAIALPTEESATLALRTHRCWLMKVVLPILLIRWQVPIM